MFGGCVGGDLCRRGKLCRAERTDTRKAAIPCKPAVRAWRAANISGQHGTPPTASGRQIARFRYAGACSPPRNRRRSRWRTSCSGTSRHEQSIGVVVREINMETRIAAESVIANSRKSRPMMPPISSSGMKAAMRGTDRAFSTGTNERTSVSYPKRDARAELYLSNSC